jgi:acetyl esterase/lipase
MIVMWYSAGWDYAMEACITLKKENIDVFAQILWYAYIWDADDMYQEELSQDQQKSIAPALFILADDDIIWDTSLEYEEILRENWIQTEIKQYSWAMHWFIESNNPEREAVTWERPEQKEMARDAEDYALQWLKNLWL